MVREEVDSMHVSTETKAHLPAGNISVALGLAILSEDDYDSNLAMTTGFQSLTLCVFYLHFPSSDSITLLHL